MIFLAGDFPAWLPLLLGFGVFGLTTALIIGAIVAGGLASAGTTAAVVKNAVEGNWPWDDFEAWSLDALKGGAGGLGSVIAAAQGEPTIMGVLSGEGAGTSRGGGTAGALQGATGQAAQQFAAEARGQTPEQQAQGGGRATTPVTQAIASGLNRYDEGETPSRSDVFKNAAKSIGIGLAGQIGGVALGGLGGALLGPAAQAGTAAAAPAASQVAPAAAGGAVPAVTGAGATVAENAAPAVAEAAAPSFSNVAAGSTSTAPAAAPSAFETALDAVREVPSQIRSVAQGIKQYSIGPLQSALNQTIGETPTSILGQTLFGAAKGAGFAAAQGDDPLRGAASGAAGGLVSSGLGAGASALYPSMETNFVPTARPGLSLLGISPQTNPFHMALQQAEPTYGSMATSALVPTLGGFASGAVNQAMTPMPPLPPEPMYQHRTTPMENYDIYGGLYGGNPYMRGM